MNTEVYVDKCAKTYAGVKAIYIVRQSELQTMQYNSVDDCFDSATLTAGISWDKYVFKENGAEFIQTMAYKNGLITVEKRVELTVNGTTSSINSIIDKITETAVDGIIAIIETFDGEKLVAGYSHALEKSMPLRIEHASLTTGQTLKIGSSATKITLKCYDTRTAREFKGQL